VDQGVCQLNNTTWFDLLTGHPFPCRACHTCRWVIALLGSPSNRPVAAAGSKPMVRGNARSSARLFRARRRPRLRDRKRSDCLS